jgi:hypothetical protein
MTVVQSIDMKKHKTFGDLAANYFWDLVHCFTFVNSVADIFDRYDITKSTTSAERERYFYKKKNKKKKKENAIQKCLPPPKYFR